MAADHTQDESPPGADPVRIIGDGPLLRSADRASLEDLRPVLEWVSLNAGEVLSLGGDRDNALYFVAEGRLEVSISTLDQDGAEAENARVVGRITVGDVVGETQTLTGARRQMTIRATTSARLVRLAKEGFDQYLAAYPDVTAKLKDVFTPRFYRRQMLLVLNEMFGELTPTMLADIEKHLTWRHVAREGVVVRRGELSDRLSVVVSGRLRLLSSDEVEHARAVKRDRSRRDRGPTGSLLRPRAAEIGRRGPRLGAPGVSS